MRRYNFFNKRRVSIQDMNDMQYWIDQDIRNYFGLHLESGVIRAWSVDTLGDPNTVLPNTNNYGFVSEPQDAIITTASTTTPSVSIHLNVGVTATYFIDDNSNMFFIRNNTTYTTTPDVYSSSGNIAIPLTSGNGTYYLWICMRTLKESGYPKDDKVGVKYYPKQYEGYYITVKYNDSTKPVVPTGYQIYLGSVTVSGAGAPYTLVVDQTTKQYAGLKPVNTNVYARTALKPSTYAYNTQMSLQDHINAIGTSVSGITPSNPHGISPDDMPQVEGVNNIGGLAGNNILIGSVTGANTGNANSNIANQSITGDNNAVNSFTGTYAVSGSNVAQHTITGAGQSTATSNIALNTINDNNIVPNSLTSASLAKSIDLPIGTIIAYAGIYDTTHNIELDVQVNGTPVWLVCDGRSYYTYASSPWDLRALFAVIGYQWGGTYDAVNGNSFQIPDLRGMFLRGAMVNSPFLTPGNPSGTSGYPLPALTNTTNRHGINPWDGGDPNYLTRSWQTGANGSNNQSAPLSAFTNPTTIQMVNLSNIGSYEYDEFGSHTHQKSYNWTNNNTHSHQGESPKLAEGPTNSSGTGMVDTEASGGSETRAKNVSIIYLIKAQ